MSNAQSWAETFAPIQARNFEIVRQDTWGHLAPKKNKSYKGTILFAISGFGGCSKNPVLIDYDFKELDSSPWLYDAVKDLLFDRSEELETGKVYKWDTTFRNYHFYGSPKLQTLITT